MRGIHLLRSSSQKQNMLSLHLYSPYLLKQCGMPVQGLQQLK